MPASDSSERPVATKRIASTDGKRGSSAPRSSALPEAEGRQLDLREQRFVKEYVVDFDVERAALAAGYSATMAKSKAYQWVRRGKTNPKPHVLAAVEERRAQVEAKLDAKLEITTERILLEAARLAFFDPRKLFHADGSPKAITELDDDTAAAISGLDVLEEYCGAGQARKLVGHIKKYRLAEKKGAVDMLMKHKGLYEVNNEQKVQPFTEAAVAMLQAIHSKAGGSRIPIRPPGPPVKPPARE